MFKASYKLVTNRIPNIVIIFVQRCSDRYITCISNTFDFVRFCVACVEDLFFFRHIMYLRPLTLQPLVKVLTGSVFIIILVLTMEFIANRFNSMFQL